MARKILHVDLDAFFCAVEEKFNPALKNHAFATGGSPEGRGVVTSCSYAARKYGIRSAMPMAQALRLCPDLITVRGHFNFYSEHSQMVMDILSGLTPLVEQISIDEAFLDVTDLPEESYRIAENIQVQIYSKLELPCSIGGASNKLIAKIATNTAKSSHRSDTYPMAIRIIPFGKEKSFLAPLQVGEMCGIGPKSVALLEKSGIKTIGDLQNLPIEIMGKIFGNFASEMAKRVQGMDDRPVGDYGGIKSVSNEVTFRQDIRDGIELLRAVRYLSEKVARRLRKKGLSGRTVRLKIRWKNFETHMRQTTLDQPTNQDSVIISSTEKLLHSIWKEGKPVRLIGVGVSGLDETHYQLSLLDDAYLTEKRLLDAVDFLKEKYGSDIVKKGIKPDNFRS